MAPQGEVDVEAVVPAWGQRAKGKGQQPRGQRSTAWGQRSTAWGQRAKGEGQHNTEQTNGMNL